MTLRTQTTWMSISVMATVLLAVAFLPSATAQRGAAGPVAVVDIAVVLQGLAERADAEAHIRARAEAFEPELNRLQSEVKSLEEALEATADSPERLLAEERVDAAVINLMALDYMVKREMDVERSLQLKGLYEDIMQAIADMAEADRIDLVLIHDGNQQIETVNASDAPPQVSQVRAQIAQRRIAFAAQHIDRTRDVIVRMNKDYANKGQ